MYFKNNSYQFCLWHFLLILIGLTLFNVSCQINIEKQRINVSEADVNEKVNMAEPGNTKEDFTNERYPYYAIWEKKNPPRVEIEATTDPQKKILTLTYSVKNTTGEPICLFHYDSPFISMAPEQRVAFMSIIPGMPRWVFGRQYYPPVIRLETDQTVTGKVSYDLPLADTHPYPGGSLSMFFPMKKRADRTEGRTNPEEKKNDKISVRDMIRRSEVVIKEDMSREARMYIGYFPEKDLKKRIQTG